MNLIVVCVQLDGIGVLRKLQISSKCVANGLVVLECLVKTLLLQVTVNERVYSLCLWDYFETLSCYFLNQKCLMAKVYILCIYMCLHHWYV